MVDRKCLGEWKVWKRTRAKQKKIRTIIRLMGKEETLARSSPTLRQVLANRENFGAPAWSRLRPGAGYYRGAADFSGV